MDPGAAAVGVSGHRSSTRAARERATVGRRAVPAAVLLGLPLLVASILVMHGLDPAAHPAADRTEVGHTLDHHDAGHGAVHTAGDEHARAAPTGHVPDCPDCATHGHLVAICVAVLVVMAGLGAVRWWRGGGATAPAPSHTARGVVAGLLEGRARPPGPAWVRLGVMRC